MPSFMNLACIEKYIWIYLKFIQRDIMNQEDLNIWQWSAGSGILTKFISDFSELYFIWYEFSKLEPDRGTSCSTMEQASCQRWKGGKTEGLTGEKRRPVQRSSRLTAQGRRLSMVGAHVWHGGRGWAVSSGADEEARKAWLCHSSEKGGRQRGEPRH
jgi:hypothetical protein